MYKKNFPGNKNHYIFKGVFKDKKNLIIKKICKYFYDKMYNEIVVIKN